MTRREWIAMIAAAPLVNAADNPKAPAAPVSIAKCASYDEDVTAKLATMFDQLGGLERVVKNKTVTVKLNMTGAPGQRFQGLAPAITHYTHPKLVGAAAYLMGRAGARRIRFVESAWATAGPLEDVMLDSGWNVRRCSRRPGGRGVRKHQRAGQGQEVRAFPGAGQSLHVPGLRFEPRLRRHRRFREHGQAEEPRHLRGHAFAEELLRHHCRLRFTATMPAWTNPTKAPRAAASRVGHEGRRQPSKSAPQELHFGENHDPGYRVPHIVADLVGGAAHRPADHRWRRNHRRRRRPVDSRHSHR